MSDFLEAELPRRERAPRADKAPPESSRPDRQRIRSPGPSLTSRRALDWFVFFLADVQTGFGAFVSVYLTAQKWTQTDIGLVLTVGAIVGLVGQIPGGAIVDAARSVRWVAAAAVLAVGISAFALASSPIFVVVFASRILQAGASCVLGPAIVAISLGLVGRKAIGARLGRNAAFASVGSGLAAAGMGACAFYFSDRAAFILVASMSLPALFALFNLRADEIDPARAHGGVPKPERQTAIAGLLGLFEIRPLLIFAGCVVLFQLANAAMLPLAASMMTLRSSKFATLLVAASIVAPQLIVALFSPWVGRKAEQWGRRPLLILCFAALAVRGLLFASLINPYLLMAAQLLDGISGATLAVLVPLIIADVAGGTGHFNLAQGAVGCAVGVGASISTTLAGYVSDRFDSPTAFLMLAGIGLAGLAAVRFAMPETRPSEDEI
ncbi:MAG TPA: MFS transporter [Roseiarcus sp.]|nr:MFS transporter [Roseiarcus sp.]